MRISACKIVTSPSDGVRGLFLCLVVFITCTGIAQSQSAPGTVELDKRIQRLERVMDNRVLLDMLQRIESVLKEVRELRGEVERIDFETRSMGKRQRDLYLDIDRRIQLVETGNAGTGGINELSLEEQLSKLEAGETENAELPMAESVNEASNPETQSNVSTVTRTTEKIGERKHYTKAYDILMAGDNEAAISAFTRFLDEYPLGPYSDNAQYWQGEANYVSRRFIEAVDSFNAVVNKYPDSVKVPDAKLKIAFALYEQDQFDESRGKLEALLDEHAGTSAARLATKRLKSMSAEGR